MPEAICASLQPGSDLRCTAPAGHPRELTMCGNGDERWWHPDSSRGREGVVMSAAVQHRQQEREAAALIHAPRGWITRFADWAEDDSDAPLDLTGSPIPAKVQMLLGRAFSDVAGLIGQYVSVMSTTTYQGGPDGWDGEVAAIHRDATGAPYALVLEVPTYNAAADQLIIPWGQVSSIRPRTRPDLPATDPWKVPQPGDPDYNEPPF